MFSFRKKAAMPSASEALPGRAQPIPTARRHFVNGRDLAPPYPEGSSRCSSAWAVFGAPRRRSGTSRASGSPPSAIPAARRPTRPMRKCARASPGKTRSCSSSMIPAKLSFEELLRIFWEGHDPTQGMRQGNDVGTQYRSAIYARRQSRSPPPRPRARLTKSGSRRPATATITTEIAKAGPFYFAEDYHQQYLAKNPHGYCGHGGTGVSCPIGTGVTS